MSYRVQIRRREAAQPGARRGRWQPWVSVSQHRSLSGIYGARAYQIKTFAPNSADYQSRIVLGSKQVG